MVRIYGYGASINVRKVLWACDELGVAAVREDWGGTGRSTSEPSFRAINPLGLVPVIDDNGVVVWESNAIIRYLAASRHRTDLLPAEPAARARVEMWMDWQGSDFNNSWRYAFQALMCKNPQYTDPAAIEESVRTCTKMVSVIDGILAREGPYIAGRTFTVADIAIGLSIHRWRTIAGPDSELPHVHSYYQTLYARPAFRQYGRDGGP
jgi:glutathione S-transferase